MNFLERVLGKKRSPEVKVETDADLFIRQDRLYAEAWATGTPTEELPNPFEGVDVRCLDPRVSNRSFYHKIHATGGVTMSQIAQELGSTRLE